MNQLIHYMHMNVNKRIKLARPSHNPAISETVLSVLRINIGRFRIHFR